jgi:hypothetical protein
MPQIALVSDTSDIKRRVSSLERSMGFVARILGGIAKRFGRGHKVNPVSRELSDDETDRFRKQMAEHGMPDESSRHKARVK